MSTTIEKPGRGKPQTEAQRVAVLAMEQDVVHRHAVRGQSFYRIEKELGITHADRVYKRAMSERVVQQRDEAYQIQRARLDALHEAAMEALERDGLDSLAQKVAEMIRDYDPVEDDERVLTDRVRATIERAYADTYKAIPVALGVHDRFVKLDGLDHAARVADAGLALEQAKLQIMAGALAKALAQVSDPTEREAALVTFGRELEAVQVADS